MVRIIPSGLPMYWQWFAFPDHAAYDPKQSAARSTANLKSPPRQNRHPGKASSPVAWQVILLLAPAESHCLRTTICDFFSSEWDQSISNMRCFSRPRWNNTTPRILFNENVELADKSGFKRQTIMQILGFRLNNFIMAGLNLQKPPGFLCHLQTQIHVKHCQT